MGDRKQSDIIPSRTVRYVDTSDYNKGIQNQNAEINQPPHSVKCVNCLNIFTSTSYLTKVAVEKPFQCRYCKKLFQQTGNLISQTRVYSEMYSVEDTEIIENKPKNIVIEDLQNFSLQCNVCKKQFMTYRDLKTHIKINESTNSTQCDICLKDFMRSCHLDTHGIISGYKPFCCVVCNKQYFNVIDFNLHIKIHPRGNQFACNKCPKTFTCKKYLAKHKRVHITDKQVLCDICAKQFSCEFYLNLHKNFSHTSEESNQCGVCLKKFTNSILLAKHKKIHAKPISSECDSDKPPQTDKSNPTLPNLTKTEIRLYECNVCNTQFGSAELLDKHFSSDCDLRECKLCNIVFSNKYNFKRHFNNKHMNKVACQMCPKKFVSSYTLTQHTRLHTGEKPFRCERCGQNFFFKSSLRRHMVDQHLKPKKIKKPSKQASDTHIAKEVGVTEDVLIRTTIKEDVEIIEID